MSTPSLTLLSCLLLTVPALAQEPAEAAAKGEIDMQTYMAEMMKLATPGAEHAELAAMAGDWKSHIKMRMEPDGPWQETRGEMRCKPILGGRYVIQENKYDFMGMPAEGVQILGFDKLKQEYTSIWHDTWSTWAVTSRGKKDADGNIVYTGQMVDVVTPKGRPFRSVVQVKGPDEVLMRMYDTIDGKEVEVMQITYQRAADKKGSDKKGSDKKESGEKAGNKQGR